MNIIEYAINKKMTGGQGNVAVIPEGYIKPDGITRIKKNGTYPVAPFEKVIVEVPLPSGSITITESGIYNVTKYEEADVRILDDVTGAYKEGWKDSFQTLADMKGRSTDYLFYSLFGTTEFGYDTLPFDTSRIISMRYMFGDCEWLTTIPTFDTSQVSDMQGMFDNCRQLINIPMFDTSQVRDMMYMFRYCTELTTIPALDMRRVIRAEDMFEHCRSMTDIHVRNIQTSLTVGSGSSTDMYSGYGYFLTVSSLTHLIYELRDTGSAKTFGVGHDNINKLANVYVKLVDITDEMRAEDDLIDEKLPFIVCESTDEGACLIEDYMSFKNWNLG